MIRKKWHVTYLPDMKLLGKYWTKRGALGTIKHLVGMGVPGKELELSEVIYEKSVK